MDFAVGKEGGVAKAAGKIDGSHHQREVGLGGGQVEIVDARDLTVALGCVPMRPFRLNLLAVDEDV